AWTELKNAINEAGLGEEMVETVKLATQALGGLVDVLQSLDAFLTKLGQGSLAEFISNLTVFGQLKSVVQSAKDLIPGGAPEVPTAGGRRVSVTPIERYRAPEAPKGGLTDEAMMAALKASVGALDDAAVSGKKYAEDRKSVV